MEYTEEQFLQLWDGVTKISNNFKELTSVISLVRHLLYDRKNGIRYINRIQDFLYEKKVIPFKATNEKDYNKLDTIKDKDLNVLMDYFCLANVELKELRNEISKTS